MLQTNSVASTQLSVSVKVNVHVMFARDVGISVSQMATFCWSLERPQVASRDDESRKTKSLVVFVCVSKRYTETIRMRMRWNSVTYHVGSGTIVGQDVQR